MCIVYMQQCVDVWDGKTRGFVENKSFPCEITLYFQFTKFLTEIFFTYFIWLIIDYNLGAFCSLNVSFKQKLL